MYRTLFTLAVLLVSTTSAWAQSAQKLLVSSYYQNSILAYDAATGASLGTFIPPGSGGLHQPTEMAIGPNGDIYVTHYSFPDPPLGPKVYHYKSSGTFAGAMSAPQMSSPRGLAVGADGMLYVSSAGSHQVLKFNPLTNAYLGVFASVTMPVGLGFGPDGNLYVASDDTVPTIQRFNALTGAAMGSFGSSVLNRPQALTFAPDGTLFLHNQGDFSILKFNAPSGTFDGVFYAGSYPYNPSAGMTFGPDGHLYTGSFNIGNSQYDGVHRFDFDGSRSNFIYGDGSLVIGGLAFTRPIPEPMLVSLMLLAPLVLLRRRNI